MNWMPDWAVMSRNQGGPLGTADSSVNVSVAVCSGGRAERVAAQKIPAPTPRTPTTAAKMSHFRRAEGSGLVILAFIFLVFRLGDPSRKRKRRYRRLQDRRLRFRLGHHEPAH